MASAIATTQTVFSNTTIIFVCSPRISAQVPLGDGRAIDCRGDQSPAKPLTLVGRHYENSSGVRLAGRVTRLRQIGGPSRSVAGDDQCSVWTRGCGGTFFGCCCNESSFFHLRKCCYSSPCARLPTDPCHRLESRIRSFTCLRLLQIHLTNKRAVHTGMCVLTIVGNA